MSEGPGSGRTVALAAGAAVVAAAAVPGWLVRRAYRDRAILRRAAAAFAAAGNEADVVAAQRRAAPARRDQPVLEALAGQARERIRLTTELQRREAPLSALVEQTADVILILNDDDRIRYASPSARGLFGTSMLNGVALLDLVDPAERRSAQYLLRHARTAEPDSGPGSRADWSIRAFDGRPARVEVSCRRLRADESAPGVVVTLRDVTAQRRLEHELTRRVYLDPLTGLPNRLSFTDRLGQAIAAGTGLTGVLLVDLDNFRSVNEGLGRATGDAVLTAVAGRLRQTAGDEHLTARLSSDEFGVLMSAVDTVQAVDAMADSLVTALARPVRAGADLIPCSATVGVATSAEAITEAELLRHADLALDAAKATGPGRWRRYESSMTNAVRYRLELTSALAQGLDKAALLLEYQPIVALATGQTAGFEALVRWHHPTRGLLAPGEFIDIAEESGLITPIGEWVLASALAVAHEWAAVTPDPPYVAVNVSARQFRSSGFVDTVRRLLTEAGLPASRLVLEITESLLLRDDDEVWEDLKRLRQWGIRIAIDDFGTGYSALGYLRQTPLDIVKLDRLFTATMATSQRQRELVHGIVDLIRTLRLDVVVEGIETRQQRDISAAIGCGYGQGYLLSHPLSTRDTFARLAREATPLTPARA